MTVSASPPGVFGRARVGRSAIPSIAERLVKLPASFVRSTDGDLAR